MLSLLSFVVDPHAHRLYIVGMYKFLISAKTLSNNVAVMFECCWPAHATYIASIYMFSAASRRLAAVLLLP